MPDNEMYVIENPLSNVTDPEKLKLGFVVNEKPADVWANHNGKMITWDQWNRPMDAHGFLVDENSNQIKDADGNFMKSKDHPLMEKK